MTDDELDYLGAERWAPCPGVPRCQVSTLGRLRGSTGRIVTAHPKEDGYMKARLWCPTTKRTLPAKAVHRLVAIAFVPNPLDLPEVHHKDANRENNCALNLEWVTREQNEACKYVEDGPPEDYREWLENGARL